MKQKRFFFLVNKQLSGAATAAETEELFRLLDQNPELSLMCRVLLTPAREDKEGDRLQAEQAYAAHYVKMQLAGLFEEEDPMVTIVKPVRNNWVGRSLTWAGAACVVLLGTGLYCFFLKKPAHSEQLAAAVQKSEVTHKADRSKVVLPDGTVVWLNADSRLTYPGEFNEHLREVSLSGEGFFEVAKDKTRPFILHTGGIDIKVLGTAFNVRSYPGEKTTETALIHGSIEVTVHGQADKKLLMKPNEKLSILNVADSVNTGDSNNEGPLLMLSKLHLQSCDSACLQTLWVQNKLAFDGDPLDNVAADISRWYDVTVTIQNDALKNRRFTGVFEHKTLNEVLGALQLTGQFEFSISNGHVLIY